MAGRCQQPISARGLLLNGSEATELFPTNKQADKVNYIRLAALPEEEVGSSICIIYKLCGDCWHCLL